MTDSQATDPEVIPWEQFQKRAEREGLDVPTYIVSMNAYILRQRAEIERLKRENAEFRAQLDALNPRKKHPHGPDALVGALQDKVHEDKGPFRAGHSVKHDDVGTAQEAARNEPTR